jgi:hypothetical protein
MGNGEEVYICTVFFNHFGSIMEKGIAARSEAFFDLQGETFVFG